MQQLFISILIFLVSLGATGCSQEKKADSPVLARINDYEMPLAEFKEKLDDELELTKEYKLTSQGKLDFLEECIRQELLIQEAKRRGLDTKKEFIRAMERYWESTLIRDLFELKSSEIAKTVIVTPGEIEERYKKLREKDKLLPPLADMHDQLQQEILDQKKTVLLENWINELRSGANVTIERNLL